MDRDLLEKLLVAQVLTLANTMNLVWHAKHPGGSTSSDFVGDAIRSIRSNQAELIVRLLAPDTAGGSDQP